MKEQTVCVISVKIPWGSRKGTGISWKSEWL